MHEMTLTHTRMRLPLKKAYRVRALAMEGLLRDVEHYRIDTGGCVPVHVAFVVDDQGRAYVGMAHCSKKDQYRRKLGHEIAIGRAFAALMNGAPPVLEVPNDVVGVRLRDYLRPTAEVLALEG